MSGLLRVGVLGLAESEAGLVRALIKLMEQNVNGFRWAFSSQPPYDALLVDGPRTDLPQDLLRQASRAWASLGQPVTAQWPGDVVQRPINMLKLQQWLSGVQEALGNFETEPMPLEPLAPAQDSAPSTQPRFQLKRWPPAELLHGDKHRIRLATLMSRRALNLGELMSLSRLPEERCVTFLHLLHGFDLLVQAPSAADSRHEQAAAPTAPARPRVERGLIQRLRDRLGL